MEEKWKDVFGYEGYYKISSLGNVQSITRTYKDSLGRFVTRKGRIQKKYIRRNYWSVWLNKDNKSTPFSIHRLVAVHFVFNYQNREYVNHINGDKLDNIFTNLEWVTAKENTNHAINNGLIVFGNGENARSVKLKEEDVFFILKSDLKRKELAKMFSVTESNIGCIKNGKSWSKFSKTLRTEINKITDKEVNNG